MHGLRPIEGSMWRWSLSLVLLVAASAFDVAVPTAAAPASDLGLVGSAAPLTSVAAAGRYYRPLTLNKLKELILENIEERDNPLFNFLMDAVIGRAENDGIFAVKDAEASKKLKHIPLNFKSSGSPRSRRSRDDPATIQSWPLPTDVKDGASTDDDDADPTGENAVAVGSGSPLYRRNKQNIDQVKQLQKLHFQRMSKRGPPSQAMPFEAMPSPCANPYSEECVQQLMRIYH